MNETTRSTRAPRRRRVLLVVLAVLALAATLAWATRARWLGAWARHLARDAGYEIAWTELTLDGLSALTIDGLRARRLDELDLRATRVHVAFDPWLLARGDLAGLERVEVEHLGGSVGPFPEAPRDSAPARGISRWPTRVPLVAADVDDLLLRASPRRAVHLVGARLDVDANGVRATATEAAWIDGDSVRAHPLELVARYDAGRFEVERARWDPRIVLERGFADLTRVEDGRATFVARTRAFDARLGFDGEVADGFLDLRARVDELDLARVVDAFLPESAAGLEGTVHGGVEARVPLAWPGDASGRVRLVATDLRAGSRALDRVELAASGTLRAPSVEELLVVHGATAAVLQGTIDRPFTDPCELLHRFHALVEADVGDVAALLEHDVGLVPAAPSVASRPSAAFVRAHVADGLVDAAVAARDVDVRDVLVHAGADLPLDGRADVTGRVTLPLEAPRATRVRAEVSTGALAAWERTLDALAAHVSWTPGQVEIEDAHVVAGANTFVVTYARIPTDPCLLETGLRARFDADCGDLPTLVGPSATARRLATLPDHRLRVSASVADGVVALAPGTFESGRNRLEINAGRVPLHDDARSVWTDPRLDVGFALAFEDVARVLALARDPGVEVVVGPDDDPARSVPTGRASGRATLRGGRAGPVGHLVLEARDVRWAEAAVDEASIEADLDEQGVTLGRLVARSTVGVVNATGRYEFDAHRLAQVRLDADVEDLARLVPELALPRGRVRAHAELDGPWPNLVGIVEADADDLAFGALAWRGASLRARFADGRADVSHASLAMGDWRAEASGEIAFADEANPSATSFGPLKVTCRALRIAAGARASTTSAPFTLIVGPRRVELTGLQMAGELGFVEAEGSVRATVGRVRARLLGVEPDRWPIPLPDGVPSGTRGDATLDASWDGDRWALTTSGRVESPAGDDGRAPHGAVDWDVRLAEGRVRVDHVDVTWSANGGRARAALRGDAPFDLAATLSTRDLAAGLAAGALDLAAEVHVDDLAAVTPASSGVAGRADATIALRGAWDELRGEARLEARSVSVPETRREAALSDARLDLRFVLDERGVVLDAGSWNVGDLARADARGRWDVRGDVRALLAGDPARALDAPLSGSLELEAADLAPIAALVPALRRTGGRISAHLDVDGSARAPRWRGRATLADAEVRASSSLPSIAGVHGDVVLEGARVTLEDVAGELGGAPFRLSGSIDAFTASPRLDLALVGESLLVWREGDVTVRADADLTLSGPLAALALQGRIALVDGRYTKKVDFLSFARPSTASAPTTGLRLFSLEEAPFADMTLDVAVSTRTPFRIANNVVRGAVSPDLQLVGTGRAPDLRGIVQVEPSRVLLPSGALQVRTGRVEFRPDRPGVPILDVRATARLQGYDVDLRVTGSSDDPRLELASVPPLPREDLVLLVLTGRPPGDGLTLAGGQRAAVDVAVYIARDVAAAWLEGKDASDVESLAERIEVIVGADRTRSGADSILVRMRLTADTGDRGGGLYLTGERDVYDFYNFGLRLVATFP